MPYVLDFIFGKQDKTTNYEELKSKNLAFKGTLSDVFAEGIAKVLNNKTAQEFASKHKDSNFPMHIVALRDIIATSAFVGRTSKSKKLSEERKAPIIYNSIISTLLSIASTYLVDKLLDKPADKFIKKFAQENISDPKLDKYIKGFKIAKPALIAAVIYYALIPLVSTFFADRVKFNTHNNENNGK